MKRIQAPVAAFAAVIAFVLPVTSLASDNVQALDVRARPADPGERTYFLGAGASVEDAVGLRDRLIAAGAWNVNLFVQERVIVCSMTPRAAVGVELPAAFRSEPAKSAQAPARAASESWGWIAGAYALADRAPVGFFDDGDAPQRALDDVLLVNTPERVREVQRAVEKAMASRATAPRPQPARAMNQNSEVLAGSILANFIFPESNGTRESNLETWSDDDMREARIGVAGAFLAWQAWTQMDINTTFNLLERVPTGYEPIQHDMSSDELWLVDTMQSLGWGFTGGNSLGIVHEFNEDARATFRTRWVVTSFIACARNTPNHRFGGGGANYTAYANLGGPYMVEPFPAGTDPNGIGETLVFSKIVQHEVGHCFWTLDEYPGAPGTCGNSSGYLNYTNGNISMIGPGGEEVRCEALTPCIMHIAPRTGQGRPWCRYSLGHLGVVDDNSNGYPDIFEAAPEIVFEPAGPETVTTNQFTLRFKAIARAVPNRNPGQDPNTRVDLASPVDEVRYVTGDNVGFELQPVDGASDELMEDFVVPIPLAAVGESRIEIRARNAAGFQSARFTKIIHFTGVNYTQMGVAVKHNRIEVQWQTVGDIFNSQFDVYRLGPGDPLPGTIEPGEVPPGTRLNTAPVAPDGPGTSGFVSYRYNDFTVEPGHDYRYYVVGSFTLPVEGGTQDYHSPSDVVGQTASLPITDEFVSGIAPNPSNGNVTLSIAVPRTYGGNPRAPQRLATPVDVSVYDVRGRRIRVLESQPQLTDRLTLRWNGRSDADVPVPAGIYFVRVSAGGAEAVRKLVLLR